MITIFSSFKKFDDTRYNSVNSWLELFPSQEITLFNTPVIDFEVYYLACKTNEYDTPYVNDMFYRAQDFANNDILAYVNSDIILFQDFIETIELVKKQYSKFLIVGRRFNWHNPKRITFVNNNWQTDLKAVVRNDGNYFNPATDYFIFPKALYSYIPDFALGRYYWDTWLYWDAMQRDIPVIDATNSIFAIHQDHKQNVGVSSPEAKANYELGKEAQSIDLLDVPYMVKNNEIQKK